MKSKSLVERVAERLAPKQREKAKKPNLMLDAIKEFRNAKTDEEALEAFRGLQEISQLDVD